MRFCALFMVLLAVTVFAGCRNHSAPPDSQSAEASVPDVPPDAPVSPHDILDRMVAAYKVAVSYADRATVQISGKMSQSNIEPAPRDCIVAFLRPNMLRLTIDEGIFVSDGEDCYAQIRPLPDQVLHFPTPANWTLETLFQDVHLDAAMALGLPRSVLRFPPQLILLFANDPLNTFIPRGAKPEWVSQQLIGEIPCDVIRINHTDGNRILWISRENNALLRMDYHPVGLPVPEGFDSIEAIRIEMTDAQFNCDFGSETFQMQQPQDAVQVAEFHSDMQGLPTLEEHQRRLKLMTDNDSYRLIDQHIESVLSSEQSLSPKTAPQTFTLRPVWSIPVKGADTMAFVLDEPRRLLIPCKGNMVAVVDLQGNKLQEILPEGLDATIIMDIQGDSMPNERRIGITTLDNSFHLFDDTFRPLAFNRGKPDGDTKEAIRCFRLVRYFSEELLLLATSNTVRALDSRGILCWEYSFEGVPKQISSAVIDGQLRVLISCSASQDSILVLSLDGTALDPVGIPVGWNVLWFGHQSSMNTDTIYVLWENPDTGSVRFAGLDRTGKSQWSQWSRSLPSGEYEVDPVYVPSRKEWFVPTPNGEIWVFNQIGNVVDKFSLDVVPTGLLCLEVDGEAMLIVADGETVSALKIVE